VTCTPKPARPTRSRPGLRILVTAGPTQEFFDSVRFISNPSSGKMGYALAAAAKQRGHHVTLVTGPVAIAPVTGIEVIPVVTADEMFRACLSAFRRCDAAVMTAAVCDYRPRATLSRKLQKSARPRTITLVPTRDIAAHLGQRKNRRVVVTFAMEDHDHHAHAERKLHRKNSDAVVLNGPGNIAGDTAVVEILRADSGWSPPIRGTKYAIAKKIITLVEQLAHARNAPPRPANRSSTPAGVATRKHHD